MKRTLSKETKKAIKNYTDNGDSHSYEEFVEVCRMIYCDLYRYSDTVYTATSEDGSRFENCDVRDIAEMIFANYSELEWLTFMMIAGKEHGTYEYNFYGDATFRVEW